MNWRAFQGVIDRRLWGIETLDPTAVEAGDEIIAPACMPEHCAKGIVEAHNQQKTE